MSVFDRVERGSKDLQDHSHGECETCDKHETRKGAKASHCRSAKWIEEQSEQVTRCGPGPREQSEHELCPRKHYGEQQDHSHELQDCTYGCHYVTRVQQ